MPNLTIANKDTILAFGKHKSAQVEDLMGDDPEYLLWLHENVHWFELEQELLEEVIQIVNSQPKRRGR